jgi:alkylation response protein AidB-like acyl-CoA dehydrogenase
MTRVAVDPSLAALEGAQPETRALNLFDLDPSLRTLLGLYLPKDLRVRLEPEYRRLGGEIANRLDDLAVEAERVGPVLKPRNRAGENAWSIAFHPAYKELERVAFGEFGLAAMSNRAGVFDWPDKIPETAKYAFTYLFSQAEFGLCCPINMTDLTARMILKFGTPELIARYVPGLTAQDMDKHLQGTMWMTEKQGGSDVGKVTTVARKDGEHWSITGDKWFCSVANADMALILARPEGAGPGTRGLGLFLVPRRRPDGSLNAFTCIRLKDKFGTRSMASGEMRFDGAFAYQLGALDRGFVQMTDMINLSRISNAVRAAGLMRRSIHEAMAVAKGRVAFGRRLIDMPLMRRQFLKMALPAEQALSVAFYAAELLDKADGGDEVAARRLRIATPLLKFRATRDARKVAGDAMEVRGGSGYVEEWAHPRMVREAHLGSIWEGTSNIVALDVARAIVRARAHEALVEDLGARLNAVEGPIRSKIASALEKAAAFAARTATTGDERHARASASALYHAMSATLFAWEAARLGKAGAPRAALARLTIAHKLSPRDPLAEDDAALEAEATEALFD